jgi:nicotinate-nucleotide pyrophosphorylase (carboxylating)
MALQEDLHQGDVTSDAIFDPHERGRAVLVARETLTLAGLPVADEVLRQVDPRLVASWSFSDGEEVAPGPVGVVVGPVRSLLRAERTLLNFVRHLSGVATLTRRCVRALGPDTSTRLVDTRKTTPGFRVLEKYAVRMGGGANHRYDLGSGVLIKDNHIAAAGSISAAVAKTRAHAPFLLRIEVEVGRLTEIEEAIAAGADVLLLDNMDTPTLRLAVAQVAGRVRLEASGTITAARLPELAPVGLDFISMGALTHSAPQVDLALKIVPGDVA